METSTPRHTCLKLQVSTTSDDPHTTEPIFVKGTWFSDHFSVSITDGRDAWLCHAAPEDVRERASQWDQPVSEYLELAERYLGFQHPGSVYRFADAGNGYKRLSWTFEKEGTKLEWRWRCKPAPDSKRTTAEILDFLMDANVKLSEEVVNKSKSFELMKEEAEKCLIQSEKLSNEKEEFESEVYAKFVSILNSKKAKLREQRDQLSKQEFNGKVPKGEEVSTDRTETFDTESDDANGEEKPVKDLGETLKGVSSSKPRGRKRSSRS